MLDWAFHQHSGIPVSVHACMHLCMHVHCPGPCRITKSILHVHVHVAFSCQCFMSMSMSIDIYIEMPECRTVWHPVSPVLDWKKLTMPKPVRYRTKLTQSGIFLVWYRTKILDADADAGVSFLDADAQLCLVPFFFLVMSHPLAPYFVSCFIPNN